MEKTLSNLTQNTSPFAAVENSLNGSKTSLNDEMETRKASDKAPSSVRNVSQTHQKNFWTWFFKVCEKEIQYFKGSYFFTLQGYASYSEAIIETWLTMRWLLDTCIVFSQFHFRTQLTSLHIVWTPYNFQLTLNRHIDYFTSSASKQSARLSTGLRTIKIFSFCRGFFLVFLYSINTDGSTPNCQSVKKIVFIRKHLKVFLGNLSSKFTKTFTYQNIKFTTPFSVPLFLNMKTLIWIAYTIGSERNSYPLEQYK